MNPQEITAMFITEYQSPILSDSVKFSSPSRGDISAVRSDKFRKWGLEGTIPDNPSPQNIYD